MPKIKINEREFEVEAGKTVLQVALENGIYIPHYCYHPHLPIAGNCRMCLVDIRPGPPKLSIACNTVVADKMEVFTENEKVAAARQGVMEFLLKNHPVDCPICDQAGECMLQEYYMNYDLKPSRLLGPQEKVKKRKALRVGKTLMLDTERCILCGRCVRFMRNVQGDDCLVIVNRRDKAEITLFPGRELTNPYSLCLTDICPVGAWTSADFRFKQRVWFLESTPSICPECSRGCNIWIDHRQGEAYRIRPRVNEQVNKSWACDEGRLAYHAINDRRLTSARLTTDRGPAKIGMNEAIKQAAELIKEAGSNLSVIVSASLSVEEGRKALALFRDKLNAKLYLHTGGPGWSDAILRCADQNANAKGLEGLGLTERNLAGIAENAVVVALETLCPRPLPAGVPAPAIVITPQLSPAAEKARLAIPATSYAESAGTVVNEQGIEQKYEAALPPKGEALPYGEILSRLATALGLKLAA